MLQILRRLILLVAMTAMGLDMQRRITLSHLILAFSFLSFLGIIAATPLVAQPCAPFIEEHPQQTTAVFRKHTDAFTECPVSEASYQQILRQWLQARATNLPPLTGVSLGRAVDFPWLSRLIADTALKVPAWQSLIIATPRGRLHALAARVFENAELRARLAEPFAGSGYTVIGLSYEKVLYGKASDHATDRRDDTLVPFDAQVWLQLTPRR